MLSKHRQLRGTAAANYRKALFNIFGEKELPFLSKNDDHEAVVAWKRSPQTRKAYEILFEKMPGSETTYIDRVLEKTCNSNTPIHQKAFAIIICDNLLNPKLSSIISKQRIVKPFLPIYEVSSIYNYKKNLI